MRFGSFVVIRKEYVRLDMRCLIFKERFIDFWLNNKNPDQEIKIRLKNEARDLQILEEKLNFTKKQ